MTSTDTGTAYIPGVCNINHMEIARRRRIGYIGTVVFVVLVGLLVWLHADWPWKLLSFVPSYMAASGYLQAKHKFCSGYGSSGRQNAQDGSTEAHEVKDKAAIDKDKRRSRQINIQALGVALVAVLVVLLIP